MALSLTDKLALLMGIPDDQQELAELYLELAESDLLAETHRTSLTKEMESLKLDLAASYYALGRDRGLSSRSEGAISISYAAERDPGLTERIASFRKLPIVERD